MTPTALSEYAHMADLRYAVILERDDDALQVIVPAFPEIHTFGENVEHALKMARDAIELSIAVRRDEGMEIPPFIQPHPIFRVFCALRGI